MKNDDLIPLLVEFSTTPCKQYGGLFTHRFNYRPQTAEEARV
jgi:hypothetical protein